MASFIIWQEKVLWPPPVPGDGGLQIQTLQPEKHWEHSVPGWQRTFANHLDKTPLLGV